MKSVLISIKPKWCEKICNGEKTIEVRKIAPKEVPFKCYIYCSKDNANEIVLLKNYKNRFSFGNYRNADDKFYRMANGKVIGEFICDKIDKFNLPYPAYFSEVPQEVKDLIKSACLTMTETHHYLGQKAGYCWHIFDLKIYDKPKGLNEFYTIDESGSDCCVACVYHETPLFEMPCRTCTSERRYLYRAPQSWQYVEEVEQ